MAPNPYDPAYEVPSLWGIPIPQGANAAHDFEEWNIRLRCGLCGRSREHWLHDTSSRASSDLEPSQSDAPPTGVGGTDANARERALVQEEQKAWDGEELRVVGWEHGQDWKGEMMKDAEWALAQMPKEIQEKLRGFEINKDRMDKMEQERRLLGAIVREITDGLRALMGVLGRASEDLAKVLSMLEREDGQDG